MCRLILPALGWSVFTLALYAGQAQEKPGQENQKQVEQRKLAEIFWALHGVEAKGRRWVVLDVGPADFKRDVEGWLIEETAGSAKLLDQHGALQTFKKPRTGEKRPEVNKEPVTLEEYDSEKFHVVWGKRDREYAKFCKPFLDQGLSKRKDETRDVFDFMHEKHALQDAVIDAGRYGNWAREVGQNELAAKLIAQAVEAYTRYVSAYSVGEGELPPLAQFVASKIVSRRRSAAISRAHWGAPRTELVEEWEAIAGIPHHEERDAAKEMVEHYKKLIAQDRAWIEPDKTRLAKMTVEQKVAYWMYHLRDAHVGQHSDPGRCYVVSDYWDPFEKEEDKKPNPAVELKKLGMAAVPQLIAHLDDARPTRCQGHWRSYAPDSFYLLRYGDCCQQIFEAVTGYTIYTTDYPLRNGKAQDCKVKAERWWQDYQKKGEKQILIEGTESGNGDSPEQARRLVAKYPDTALASLRIGTKKSKDADARTSLVRAAEGLKTDKVVDFFKEELSGPYLGSRIAAARALSVRGVDEGVKALMHEWSQCKWEEDHSTEIRWTLDDLVSALAQCGDPTAIRLLGKDFEAKPISIRARIVESCADLKQDLQGRPLKDAVQAAIEELLVRALSDMDELNSLRGGPEGKELSDPAISDLAAEVLVKRWKQPGLFDVYGPLGVRERQRIEVKNVWLKKRGKESIPVPPRRKIEPAPEATLGPLLQAVRDAKTAETRRDAIVAVEKLSLSALPGINGLLKSMKSTDPSHADLQGVAKKTALIIGESRFSSDSIKPGTEVKKQLDELQSKPITKTALLTLLRSATGSLPPGSRGVKITLERLGDNAGADLTVTLIPDRPARKGLSQQLTMKEKIVLGKRSILNMTQGFAGIGRDVDFSEVEFKEFAEKLAIALDAPPGEYLLVRVSCAEMR